MYAFLEFLLILTSSSALEWHYKPQRLFQVQMLPSSIHVEITDMVFFLGEKYIAILRALLSCLLCCFTLCSINRSVMFDTRNQLFYWV